VEALCSSATSVAFDSRHRLTFRWRLEVARAIFAVSLRQLLWQRRQAATLHMLLQANSGCWSNIEYEMSIFVIVFSPEFWRCQKQEVFSGRHIYLSITVRLYLAYLRSATGLRSALFWVLKQRVAVIHYRRFGTTYRSYLQVSRIQKALLRLWRWIRKVVPKRR
jgi:hypothetical protein